MLLTVAMAAADALLDPLRVPRQIVIHNHRAELKIDPFRPRFGGNHDLAFFAEVIDQCRAHVGGLGPGDTIRSVMARKPILVDGFGLLVGIRAVEQDDMIGERAICEHPEQIGLGAARLSENDRLFFCTKLSRLCKSDLQRLKKRATFGVLLDRRRKRCKFLKLGNFQL